VQIQDPRVNGLEAVAKSKGGAASSSPTAAGHIKNSFSSVSSVRPGQKITARSGHKAALSKRGTKINSRRVGPTFKKKELGGGTSRHFIRGSEKHVRSGHWDEVAVS